MTHTGGWLMENIFRRVCVFFAFCDFTSGASRLCQSGGCVERRPAPPITVPMLAILFGGYCFSSPVFLQASYVSEAHHG